jgi:predicted transcriptional regulator of viral defense system
MNLRTFLTRHPVFTRAEIDTALAGDYSGNRGTANSRLAHHVRAGHVIRIQRGLYASAPTGRDPVSFVPDPWLVAARLADDAVLAYRSAFEFHGRAYSVSNEVVFLSRHAVRPKEVRGYWFRRVPFPRALLRAGQEQFGVETVDRQGLDVRVTSLERALVDLLDRPDLSGGWEELWRALESVEYYDLAQLVSYALLLGNATTAAKVGFFLEQHRERLMVDKAHLARLRQARPRQPHYLEPGTPGRLAVNWNLIVPESIAAHAWDAET